MGIPLELDLLIPITHSHITYRSAGIVAMHWPDSARQRTPLFVAVDPARGLVQYAWRTYITHR